MTLALELALVAFVLSTAVATALLRDLLASIVVFAAFSLGVSIIWVILQAPDVALTEAAVGAGMRCIAYRGDSNTEADLSSAHDIVGTPSELRRLLLDGA